MYLFHFIVFQGPSSSSGRHCCLCCCDLATCKGKNHRKRLESCENELVKKLQECLLQFCNRDIQSFNEFNDDSILCYECIQTLNKLVQADKEVMHFNQIVSRYLQRFTNDNISRKRPQPSEPHTPQLAKRRKPQPKRVLHSPSAVSVCNKCIL